MGPEPSTDHSSTADSKVLTRAAIAVLALTLAAYGLAMVTATANGRIWIDEASYVVKSLGYVTGKMHPYTDEDATWYMPLYFYQLGWAQLLFGAGHAAGRWMSAVFGLGGAALVFMICRRLNFGAFIAALAVALYLLTPTTTYYFSGATPIATVAFLTLLAVYLILISRDNPRPWISAALGVLFWALFFYRQNMILAVVVLAPAYIYVVGRRRAFHAGIVAAVGLLLTAVLLAAFPAKLAFYALRLPFLAPLLQALHLLPDTWTVIERTSDSRYALSPGLGRLLWRDPVNAFLLPYLGTIVLALWILCARGAGRVERAIAALFFFLAATHYLGSAGYCAACILTYTNYFVGLGVIAAAAALHLLARHGLRPPLLAAIAGAALALNASVNAFAFPDPDGTPSRYRSFPYPLVEKFDGLSELDMAERLAGIISATTPREGKILTIHSLSAIPYAVTLAHREVPAPVLNLRQSYRTLKPGLGEVEKRIAQATLEGESFWCDETMLQWLDHDVSAVLLQQGAMQLREDMNASLARNFVLKANALYLGSLINIYVRRDSPPS